jgi:peptidoglycan/LPS O-acetylase OafA/YrhL
MKATQIRETPAAFHLGYRPWLDGLRGVAILLVLAYHFGLLPGGFFGVDLFFVLSGFLITTLLVEEWECRGTISLKRFYLRRSLRLLPAFCLLLLAGYAFTLLFRPADVAAYGREMCIAGCYLANWPHLHGAALPTMGHTWSLSTEEQFYLLWPLLLLSMLRLRVSRRTILLTVAGGILASAAVRALLFSAHPPRGPELGQFTMELYVAIYARADSLLSGCFVGLLAAWNMLPRSPLWQRASGGATLAAVSALAYTVGHAAADQFQNFYGRFTFVALMTALILSYQVSAPSGFVVRLLGCAPLVFVGRISYGLYLYHHPVMYWLRDFELVQREHSLLSLGLTLVVALASYYAIERPCLKLKSRLAAPLAVASEPSAVRPVNAWRSAA